MVKLKKNGNDLVVEFYISKEVCHTYKKRILL